VSLHKDGCVGDWIIFEDEWIAGLRAARTKETVYEWMVEWILMGVEGRKFMQLNECVRKCLTSSIN